MAQVPDHAQHDGGHRGPDWVGRFRNFVYLWKRLIFQYRQYDHFQNLKLDRFEQQQFDHFQYLQFADYMIPIYF